MGERVNNVSEYKVERKNESAWERGADGIKLVLDKNLLRQERPGTFVLCLFLWARNIHSVCETEGT